MGVLVGSGGLGVLAMSRYAGNRGYHYGDIDLKAKPYRAPTPAKPFAYKVTGGKAARNRYEDCHLHWRAGLIDSWYYGRRSPSDPTIVWEINGHEIGFDEIPKLLMRQREAYQVSSLYWGETWVGYRSVVVTSTSGETIREHYDPALAAVVYETAETARNEEQVA